MTTPVVLLSKPSKNNFQKYLYVQQQQQQKVKKKYSHKIISEKSDYGCVLLYNYGVHYTTIGRSGLTTYSHDENDDPSAIRVQATGTESKKYTNIISNKKPTKLCTPFYYSNSSFCSVGITPVNLMITLCH